jgi:4-hydroxybenzoate polyprenyltransferase
MGPDAPLMARSSSPSTSSVAVASADEPLRQRSLVAALALSLRPHQWTKNLVVFAGLVFGDRRLEASAAGSAVVAFVVFCLLSGVVYLINDVRDREADRLHPTKRHRPVASGALSPTAAVAVAVALTAVALAAAFILLPVAFGLVATAYVVLLGLYSTSVKHLVVLDVLTIAVGFVLRAWGGAVAVEVMVGHWLLLLTLLLALFLGLSKRRAELVTLADRASAHRPSLGEYSSPLLDQMISIVAASTLLAYALYTIDPQTVANFGTDRLLWTFPFPLYGILRYLYLVHQREAGGDPAELLLKDGPMLLCVALWGVAVLAIVYGPWIMPALMAG